MDTTASVYRGVVHCIADLAKTVTTLGPPVPSFGPTPCRLLLLGEAPGEHETDRLRPFVGPSGRELRRMLNTVGVSMDECRLVNVFSRRPPSNDIAAGYGTLTPSPESKALGPLTSNPTTWLDDAFFGELERTFNEIEACRPHVIVALGNTATWALGLGSGINNLRGTVHLTHVTGRPLKVLPTYRPEDILRMWDLRTISLHDLEKAKMESDSPNLNFDNTELWLEPTLEDLVEFGDRWLASATLCALDVETRRGQITCLCLTPVGGPSLTIPFWKDGPQPNYWPSYADECFAWGWVRRWVEDPRLTKVTQNGLYDCQYLIVHGMKPKGFTEDSMLASHSLYCELRKGLGFLGSIYSNFPAWKSLGNRHRKKEEALKKDD